MTDNPYAQPQDFAGEAQYLEPKTSILAIFAFVISLVGLVACCIPGVGPLGLLLGVVALVMISSSGGRKKGSGLAIAAIIIGLIAGLINISLLWGGSIAGRQWAETGIVLVDVDNRDLAAVQGHLVSAQAQTLTQDQLDAFAQSINDQYGSQQERPQGMVDAVTLMLEVGQRMQNAQTDIESEYPQSQFSPIPIAIRYDQGPVLFLLVVRTDAAQSNLAFTNIGYYDTSGSLVWLLPTPSGQGSTALPPSGPSPPADGQSDDADADAGDGGQDEEPGEG